MPSKKTKDAIKWVGATAGGALVGALAIRMFDKYMDRREMKGLSEEEAQGALPASSEDRDRNRDFEYDSRVRFSLQPIMPYPVAPMVAMPQIPQIPQIQPYGAPQTQAQVSTSVRNSKAKAAAKAAEEEEGEFWDDWENLDDGWDD